VPPLALPPPLPVGAVDPPEPVLAPVLSLLQATSPTLQTAASANSVASRNQRRIVEDMVLAKTQNSRAQGS
jgi:hypothetical protein